MKLYIAAAIYNSMHIGGPVFNRLTDVQKRHRVDVRYLLESYHYFNSEKHVDNVRRAGEKVFLDSGAFSSFTKGTTIDLGGYCDFIHRNADIIECASVLDAIGDPLATWHNQHEMERRGVRALPCYHTGEDPRYLEHYVANYEYITLGGLVGSSTKALITWLDTVWDKYLVDGAGRPKLKVHGFGITSRPVMSRYPWYSIDSAGWVQLSSAGGILHPDHGYIYISSTSPSRKEEGRHFDTFSEVERALLAAEFERVGYTVDELRESYLARRTFCMWAFGELNKRWDSTGQTFAAPQPGLFQ